MTYTNKQWTCFSKTIRSTCLEIAPFKLKGDYHIHDLCKKEKESDLKVSFNFTQKKKKQPREMNKQRNE